MTLIGNESTQKYFPSPLDSYWVYVDQNGNQLTRRAIEGPEIDGKTYHAFSYEPELEDWIDFNRYMHPFLFHIGEDHVMFFVGGEVENAMKARLTKEMEIFSKLLKNTIENNSPADLDITLNVNHDVTVEAEAQFSLLPIQAELDKAWDATQISAKITIEFDVQGLPDFQEAAGIPKVTLNFAILEKGKILGPETVKTAAGTFEDCLKIEYRTETKMTSSESSEPEAVPGESVTTLWLAPKIGIVKFHQEADKIFLHTMSEKDLSDASLSDEEIAEITSASVKTFELKEYEIVSDTSQGDDSN